MCINKYRLFRPDLWSSSLNIGMVFLEMDHG